MRVFAVSFGLTLLVSHYLDYCVCPFLNANVQGRDLVADEDNDATTGKQNTEKIKKSNYRKWKCFRC